MIKYVKFLSVTSILCISLLQIGFGAVYKPTLEFFSLSGVPYIRVHKGKIHLQDLQEQIQENKESNVWLSVQPLHGITACIDHIENLYKNIDQAQKAEETKLSKLSKVDKPISGKKDVIQVSNSKSKIQGSNDVELVQSQQSAAIKLKEDVKEKEEIESEVDIYEPEISVTQTPHEPTNSEPVKNVPEVATEQNKIKEKCENANLSKKNKTEDLKNELNQLQYRIEELEQALTLLNNDEDEPEN